MTVLLPVVLLCTAVFYYFLRQAQFQRLSQQQLIGGQKDEYGCLIPAGYSWCAAKHKCLRTWEEDCVKVQSDTKTYVNQQFGFELAFPKSWEGYKATSSPTQVSFSFGGSRQPFSIFSVIYWTTGEWEKISNKSGFKVLDQTSQGVLVCDGCCFEAGDTSGGGQFDNFQVERCSEAPGIVNTFSKI